MYQCNLYMFDLSNNDKNKLKNYIEKILLLQQNKIEYTENSINCLRIDKTIVNKILVYMKKYTANYKLCLTIIDDNSKLLDTIINYIKIKYKSIDIDYYNNNQHGLSVFSDDINSLIDINNNFYKMFTTDLFFRINTTN